MQFVQLREKPDNPITNKLTLSSFGDPGPSQRTEGFLRATAYSGDEDLARMIHHTKLQLNTQHHAEALHALGEISYLAATNATKRDRGLAMELYLDAVEACWHYAMLKDEHGNLSNPNGPLNRETADVYNTSLEKLLRLVNREKCYQLGQAIRMPISGRILEMDIPFPSRWLSADQLGEFEFVADYELKNLRNRHQTAGLGVPLMVRRRRQQSAGGMEEYYEDGVSLPVTVLARFPNQDMTKSECDVVSLQLFDPRESDGFVEDNTLLPLASDLSTPLAWFLTDPEKSLLDTFAFLRPDKAQALEGLYMITPYDPDRIPVLMVHGLWSSPVTWMEMFNDLQSDPQLREKYQFWFYMYPTGVPLTFAAANLRDRLKQVRQNCDPDGQNEKLDQMVVVGHSMGGLMSYLLTVESDDKLWTALSKLPVEKIRGDAEVQQQIRRVFFFEADNAVDRIVTIASPFNGSGYANRFTQWLSGSIISLPNTTSRLSQLIFKQNNQSMWDRIIAPRTSLDSLNKNSAIIKLVNQTSTPEVVNDHNVVGISSGTSINDWTDGVVRLRRASRADPDSQIRVKASHGEVHRHPQTIAEVRRILHEHLIDLKRRKYPVVPVNAEAQANGPVRAREQAALAP